jgi:uncharacterized protein with NRDE domain
MCVVALAYHAHPRWQVVLAGNRDEYHARAALPLARWDDAPGVIAGRDIVSGGSWLGVSEAGHLAVVTNVRGELGPDPALASRGALVSTLLRGAGAPVGVALNGFNAFNLLTVSQGGATLLTNRPEPKVSPLYPGYHAISNGELTEPWPRKDALQSALQRWVESNIAEPDDLFNLLRDERSSDGGAPLFIRDTDYGTRCSTVGLIDAAGQGLIIERRFAAGGAATGESRFNFRF